jgi:FkbM family methyltransferase
MYSQFGEEQIILDYFNSRIGNVLDIGANDGKKFSNSLKLIENGWNALLVEPTKIAFEKLSNLHSNRENVFCKNVAVSTKNGTATMKVNGSFYDNNDTGLLSFIVSDIDKKDSENYEYVEMVDFETLIKKSIFKTYDLISIDIEGHDFDVLQQIDLKKLNTQMLIVEYDGCNDKKYIDYCNKYDMTLHKKTITNLIFTK